jgi:hypothetical protein
MPGEGLRVEIQDDRFPETACQVEGPARLDRVILKSV